MRIGYLCSVESALCGLSIVIKREDVYANGKKALHRKNSCLGAVKIVLGMKNFILYIMFVAAFACLTGIVVNMLIL